MQKKGIIFDMDGTLWDSAEGVAVSWNKILNNKTGRNWKLTVDDIHGIMGKTMDDIADIIFSDYSKDDRRQLMKLCFEYENEYLREHGGKLYPRLFETLKKLKEKYELFIVSNSQAGYIETFIDYYDCAGLFTDHICFGDNGLTKDKNIKLIMERNKLERSVYVGDIQADMDASLKAGCNFIHAAYGFGKIGSATLHISQPCELIDAAGKIFDVDKHGVLITGASRGIGRALAIEFAKRGADIIVTCRENEYELSRLLYELEAYGVRTYGFAGDLSDSRESNALFDELRLAVKSGRLSGLPDVIINNAGVSYIGLIQDMTDEDWSRVIGTNLTAPFNNIRNAVPYMVHNRKGLIINISSIWGKCGASAEAAYSASKAGLEGLTRALASELEPSNIDVIAFRPGMINTDMNRHFDDEDMNEIRDELLGGRMGEPGEVAGFIADLVYGQRFETGDIIDIPFGWFKNI